MKEATRTWKPRAYRPPMLANGDTFRAQMGIAPVIAVAGRFILPFLIGGGILYAGGYLLKDQLGLQPSRIPLSALLAGIGAAAYVSADILPEGAKPIAFIAAIGGTAASIYVLFTPPADVAAEKAPPPTPGMLPRTVPPGEEPPRIPAGALAEQFSLALDPLQERTGGTSRNMLANQPYAFSVRNESGKPVSFFAGLGVYDSDGTEVFASPPAPTTVGRKLITVPPRSSISEILTADSISFWLPQTVSVEVQLFRNRDDKRYFMRSDAIGIKYSYIG